MRPGCIRMHLIDSAESMRVFVPQNQSLSGFDAVSTIRPKAGVSAVVKQNDMSVGSVAINAFARVAFDDVGGSSPPIKAGYVPHHGFESEVTRNAEHRRSARTKRRTKKSRHNSGDVGNHLRAVRQLPSDIAV